MCVCVCYTEDTDWCVCVCYTEDTGWCVPVITEDTDWCVPVVTEDTDWCVCVILRTLTDVCVSLPGYDNNFFSHLPCRASR